MSITGEFITRSAEETFELGQRIGGQLNSRSVFLLSGDLGAGKTVFAKGVAEGLDIDSTDVTSPSFTLINVYDGRLRLYHVDLYRIDEGACPELGLEEILDEERCVVIIEWAERLNFVPDGSTHIEIVYLSDSERKIIIRNLAQ